MNAPTVQSSSVTGYMYLGPSHRPTQEVDKNKLDKLIEQSAGGRVTKKMKTEELERLLKEKREKADE